MTCRDVEAMIIPYAAGAPVPPEAAAHIAGCESCRRLVRAMQEARQIPAPAPEHLSRVEAAILADLKPVKPLAPASVLLPALLLAVAVVATVGVIVLGTAGWHALSLVQRAAVFTALAAAGVSLAFSLCRQIVPGSRLLPAPRLLVSAVVGILAGIVPVLFHPHAEATFVATGLVCLRIGLECAIPAALLFWLVLRRGAVLNPVATGATAGAMAGLAGLVVLEIFCPNPNEYHILVWHLGAVLASIAAGLTIGSISEYFGRSRKTV